MSNLTPTIIVTRRCKVFLATSGLEDSLTAVLSSLGAAGPDTLAECLAALVLRSTYHGSVSISEFVAEWWWDEERDLVFELEAEGRENQ